MCLQNAKIKSKKHKNPKGFTLIEVVLALAILSIGLVAIMNLSSLNLRTTMDSRDQIVAASLAQDGLELVFNIKDNNRITGASDQFQFMADGNSCRIDDSYVYPASGAINCASGQYQLRYNLTNGFIHTGGGTATKFFRRITIATVGGNKVVTAYVGWSGADPDIANCNIATRCVSAKMTLSSN